MASSTIKRHIKTCDKYSAPIKYRRKSGNWVAYNDGTLIKHKCMKVIQVEIG